MTGRSEENNVCVLELNFTAHPSLMKQVVFNVESIQSATVSREQNQELLFLEFCSL